MYNLRELFCLSLDLPVLRRPAHAIPLTQTCQIAKGMPNAWSLIPETRHFLPSGEGMFSQRVACWGQDESPAYMWLAEQIALLLKGCQTISYVAGRLEPKSRRNLPTARRPTIRLNELLDKAADSVVLLFTFAYHPGLLSGFAPLAGAYTALLDVQPACMALRLLNAGTPSQSLARRDT